jgi:hypothetical protein
VGCIQKVWVVCGECGGYWDSVGGIGKVLVYKENVGHLGIIWVI